MGTGCWRSAEGTIRGTRTGCTTSGTLADPVGRRGGPALGPSVLQPDPRHDEQEGPDPPAGCPRPRLRRLPDDGEGPPGRSRARRAEERPSDHAAHHVLGSARPVGEALLVTGMYLIASPSAPFCGDDEHGEHKEPASSSAAPRRRARPGTYSLNS